MDAERKPITVGIPRAMLYYQYGTIWKAFFEALGVKTVLSPPTNREILEEGIRLSVDETCLSAKVFMGHVHALIGKCDYIFIPRYSSFRHDEVFCTRFEGLYDQTRNIFRTSPQRFLSCNIDAKNHQSEGDAFQALGVSLGFSAKESRQAYRQALKKQQAEQKAAVRNQEAAAKKDGLKILIVGHPYLLSDPYLGKPILDFFRESGTILLRADHTNRDRAKTACMEFSPTCRWIMSKELVGGAMLWKDRADGMILLSAFPCGPDSMTNELMTRKLKDIPVLNLVLDAQSGTAGIETRLESFLDIIRFKKGSPV